MNANEFADELEKAPTLWFKDDIAGKWIVEKLRQQQEQIDKLTAIVALRELKIERMVEDRSKYEALAHVGSVEAGKELAQAEIEALKQIIDANNLNQNIGQFVKAADEPVAWMFQGAFDVSTYVSFEKPNLDIYPNPTPLYTHPVKELTDEEIRHIQAICHLKDVGYDNFIMRFARAILRKAQEK